MKVIREYTAFKALTFLLAIALLIPSTVKLIHIFEHHEHKVCVGGDTTHIHNVDLDCEFQKFHVTHFFTSVLDNYESTLVDYSHKISYLRYKFLNNHSKLSFSLRGPPVLV